MHLSHRIIAILVVCWIPFCCCSIKAMASIAAGGDSSSMITTSCCSNAHCDASGEPSDERPGERSSCAGCCDRFAPDGAERESLPEIDEIGSELPVDPTPSCIAPMVDEARSHRIDARPPDPPPGSLQDLRCRFQV